MSDENDDPWEPHDPWRKMIDPSSRLPGLRGDHTPLRRGVSLGEMPPTSRAEPSPLKPTVSGPIGGVESSAVPATLQVQIVASDGVPLADLGLVITQPGGSFEASVRTDDEGLVEVSVPDGGPYDVRFEPFPPKLPPRVANAPAEPLPWIDRACEIVHATTTKTHRLVLRRPEVTEIIIDGWAQGSQVMRWGGMRPRIDGTVATTRAALRMALQRARGQTLCIGGHADPVGSDASNEAVATERANSVQLFLGGLLHSWAEHAAAWSTPLDVQCALVACHVILGLGAVTLDDKDALAFALAEIRARANAAAATQGEPTRDDDAPFGVYDWRVVADLYDLDLAIFMGTGRPGLASIREQVAWTDAPSLSFGERHPRPAVELADVVELPALSHRRVSLLVFGPGDGAQVAVDGGGDEIYDGTYTRRILAVPSEALVQIRVATADGDPVAKGRAWLDVGELGTSEYKAGPDGIVRLLTLAGDKIRVVAAYDEHGLGTMISAAMENV